MEENRYSTNSKRWKIFERIYFIFFGFVNDKHNNSYTIGVTVINPISTGPNWYYYYASSSAVPVFREIVQNLVKLNYLIPDENINFDKKVKEDIIPD